MITRENYEIYFIDYMDGVLPDEERAEVEAFLLVHPNLGELLDDLDQVRLQPGREIFSRKEELKQKVDPEELEYHAIAAAEGVITAEERRWVADNVEDDTFEQATAMHARLRVRPDRRVVFEKKDNLRRASAVILALKHYAAVAAVVALGIVIAIYSTRKDELTIDNPPMRTARIDTPGHLTPPVFSGVHEQPSTGTTSLAGSVETSPVAPPVPSEPRGERAIVAETPRIAPVDLLEIRQQLTVPKEILAPRPSEILTSPYEGVQFHLSPPATPFQAIGQGVDNSDNIVSSIIRMGREVVNKVKRKNSL